MRLFGVCFAGLWLLAIGSGWSAALHAQQPKSKLAAVDLDRAHAMLRQTYKEVKQNYYDPTFHGVNLDASYQHLDARLNASQTVNDSFRVIAAFLMQLQDSHTFFQPPARVNRSTMGYEMEMVGDQCLVTRIRPGTDAAKKLHVGDQVLALNHFAVKRADFWNMRYFYQTLSPAPAEVLNLQSPEGERREVTIIASLRPGKKVISVEDGGGDFWQLVRSEAEAEELNRQRYVEKGDVLIWKMPTFEVLPEDVSTMWSKARKHQTLVLDLRGNPGGSEDTLKDMLSYAFDHDVKVADRVSRKGTKSIIAKTRGKNAFTGKIILLVDSESGSAAELFARVVQLGSRGRIIGDRTAGAVMEAHDFEERVGADPTVLYGLSVTSANLLMADGMSLEHTGVTPDEAMLPSAADLSEGKDPVMARALQLAGLTADPAAAGKLFPYEWPTL